MTSDHDKNPATKCKPCAKGTHITHEFARAHYALAMVHARSRASRLTRITAYSSKDHLCSTGVLTYMYDHGHAYVFGRSDYSVEDMLRFSHCHKVYE